MNPLRQKNIAVYAILLLVFVPVYSPVEGWSQVLSSQVEDSIFEISVMNFPSDSTDMTKARLFIIVGNEALRFLKAGDNFKARYEITVDIFDSNDDNIGSEFLVREITYDAYEYTIDIGRYVLESFDFDLTPGTYKFVVQMTDTDSNSTYTQEETNTIRSFRSKSVGLSDLIFAEGSVKNWSDVKNRFALFTRAVTIDYTDGFSVYVQVYSADTQAVEYAWQIVNSRDDSEIVMSKTNPVNFPNGPVREIILSFTGESFPRGTYIFKNEVRHPGGDKDSLNQKIGINWKNPPQTAYVLKNAIEQMSWIIPDEDIPLTDRMTPEEKEEYFKAFWKQRDPTPNTERNELTEEYFMRIDYANEYFGYRGRAGWNTDRGRVYSIYGNPDRREDTSETNAYQVTDRSVPQIIWTYYKVRKIFIFADQDRNGNYVLISEEALIRD